MKKILIIADRDLGTSGVPAVIMSIVRGLHTEYIFDIILFERNESTFLKEFSSYGGNMFYFDINKPSSLIRKILFYLFGFRRQVFKEFRKKVNINEYTCIHSFKGIFSAPFLEYAKRHCINNRILHINGVYDKNKASYLEFLNKINRKKCLKATNIRLAVSDEAGKSFFGRKDFVTVLNPINDALYKKLPKYNGRISLTQIGTFSDRKNQLFSLEVFKIVKARHENAVLNFLGYEVELGYIERVKTKIKEYGIENSVFFYDKAYNQLDLLKETSICLVPSKSEAFGLVVVENQACNRPVLCSNKIIKEVDCGGVVFLPFDAQRWADTVEKIVNNDEVFDINTSKFNNDLYCSKISSFYISKTKKHK